MGRPAKTLAELVRDGSFRARRDTHRALLLGPDLPWEWGQLLQARYRAAESDAEQRQIALECEHAVRQVHQQAAAQASPSQRLQAELANLGEPGSVEQLLAFFPYYLRHPKGPARSRPFQLEAWQQQFLAEFYRRDSEGRRVYRVGLLGIPRGNGKTALAAGLGLYELLSRQDAPEIYFAAGSKEQAKIALSFARSFAEEGPLAQWISRKSRLLCPATSGSLQVISSEGALQHGLAPAAVILDELWAFQTSHQVDVYDAFASALHKRRDAYLLAISTAGYDTHSLLGRIYQQALAWPEVETHPDSCLTIAKDQENGLLLWWYGAAHDADPTDEQLWRACNPASFVDLRDLKRQRNDPGLGELGFRRLHLNQWTAARDAWLPAGSWDALKDETKIPAGAAVYVGVDIALSHDTSAVAWAHRLPDGRIIVRA
jgi:phage terminase large subunit-like protein